MSGLKLDYEEGRFIQELKTLGKGKLFIDVGACIGCYAINLADQFDEVWAIEPCKVFVNRLKANIKRFNISNIRIITKAISDKSESTIFYGNALVGLASDSPSLKQTVNLSYEGKQKRYPLKMEEIETTTLSDLIGKREVDLVKVDVEGTEKDVLWGSQKVMHQIKAWHIEVHDWNDTAEITQLLKFFGYKVKERGLDGRNRGWLLATR